MPQSVDRGQVSFLCEHVSPQAWRVDITEENTSHPCGVNGMGGINLEVSAMMWRLRLKPPRLS